MEEHFIIVNFKKFRVNKALTWVYLVIIILCYGGLFGGLHSTKPLLRFFDAPDWAYVLTLVLLILNFILLVDSIFNPKYKGGTLVICDNIIEVAKKKSYIYPINEIKNLNAKANWSVPKVSATKQNWILDFDYNGEHYHYDFLLPPEQKDALLNALGIRNL